MSPFFISSLVAMTDISSREHHLSFGRLRLDEVLFSAVAEVSKIYPDLKLKFENETTDEADLEIMGDETLLRIDSLIY